MKKVCVVTGTRAEYGILKGLISKINLSDKLELLLAVTGTHLSHKHGYTCSEIEEDGYPITGKINMLIEGDSEIEILKSMAVCLDRFGAFFTKYQPDLLILLGDRTEIFMVATAALICKIPIAHIHGGEVTEGAYDDAMRHSITKMSHLHFTATEEYKKRVIQLGEMPQHVYNVGSLGVENIKSLKLLTKEELKNSLEFNFSDNLLLVTYHPTTLEGISVMVQIENLLKALDRFKEYNIIFTKANSDRGGEIINYLIDKYVEKNKERCRAYHSLGQKRYFSVLQYCKAVIGNSSSGIIEVPSFRIPTVNVGDRQKGRIFAKSIVQCGYEENEIAQRINQALSKDFKEVVGYSKNPYEGKDISERIIEIIEEALENGISVKKSFHDLHNF